jgi:hypothetical protein
VSAWLRAAGRGRLADGGIVVWSVAEGARGRRWRWTIDDIGVVRHAGLLELDTEGRFVRLELAGSAGLLTLHPEPDGALHGNVVNDDGVRPIALPGAVGRSIRIDGDAFGSALLPRHGPGEGIVVGFGFSIASAAVGPGGRLPDVDVRGVPQLDEATEWLLEPAEAG